MATGCTLLDARYCVRVGPSGDVVRLYLPRRPGVAIEICSDSDPGYSTGEQNFCGSKQQFAARLTGERHCVAYRELEQRLQLGRTWCLAWEGHDCCGETGAIERKAVFCPNFFQAMGELLSEEADALYGASDGADAAWLLRSLGMKLDSDAFQGCYEPDFGALCYSDPFVCRAFASEPAESWDDEGREESPPEAQIAPRQWPKEEEEEENLQRDGRLESRYLIIRQRPWAPKQDAVEGLDGLVTVPDAAETIVDGQLVELLACSVSSHATSRPSGTDSVDTSGNITRLSERSPLTPERSCGARALASSPRRFATRFARSTASCLS